MDDVTGVEERRATFVISVAQSRGEAAALTRTEHTAQEGVGVSVPCKTTVMCHRRITGLIPC